MRGEHGLDENFERGFVFNSRRVVMEPGVGCQSRIAQYVFTEPLPFAAVLHGNDDKLTVLAFIGPVRANDRVVQSDTRCRLAKVIVIQQRNRHPVGHHIKHCHGNAAALAGAITPDKCFADSSMGCHTGGDIADRHAHPSWSVGCTGH